MHQEPDRHPRGGRHHHRERRQGQRLPLQHGRLRRHERGVQDLLGRRQALQDVRVTKQTLVNEANLVSVALLSRPSLSTPMSRLSAPPSFPSPSCKGPAWRSCEE